MVANDWEMGNGWLTYSNAAALQSRASRCENCSNFARPVSLQISSHVSHVGSLGKIDLLMAGGQVQAIYQLVGSTEARDQRLAWIAQFSWKAENISF